MEEASMLLMASTDKLFSCLFNNLEKKKSSSVFWGHKENSYGFANLETKVSKKTIQSSTPSTC